jgi:SHS2 domain-containing protein
MPYSYLEDVATADVAFEASGGTLEAMFAAAADATMNVMVRDLSCIADAERLSARFVNGEIDMLLFELLQELIYHKDADRLLLRPRDLGIRRSDAGFELTAELQGERIDPAKHELLVDVKAVTLHRFLVERTADGWRAFVILDV